MVNQRLSELVPAIEERWVIMVIPTNSQDKDHLKKNIQKYSKCKGVFMRVK